MSKENQSPDCKLIWNAENDPTWDTSLNEKLCSGECNGCQYSLEMGIKRLKEILLKEGIKFEEIKFKDDPKEEIVIEKDSTTKFLNLLIRKAMEKEGCN